MNNSKYIIGIDIGKTKIACGIFSANLCLKDCLTCPSGKSSKEILDITEKAVERLWRKNDVVIVGIAIAAFGIIDTKLGRVLKSGIIPDWVNIPLREYFEERFHVPVYVENDVKSALYGEYWIHKHAGNMGVLYLSVGTNIGIAYIKDHILWHGDNGAFGEISGYVPANEKRMLGNLIGGGGISQQYYEQTGIRKSAEEIFAGIWEGDIVADEIYRHMAAVTARLLYWLELCLDPGRIVVGGGVVCGNPSLFRMIKAQYEVISGRESSLLHMAELGEKSGIYGAAALFRYKMYEAHKGLGI